MSNVNTDQRLTAAQMSPITAPTAATITYVQFNTSGQNNGVAAGTALLPIPGQFKAQNKRVKVRLNYSVFGATVGSQALTVAIYSVNNAATPVSTIIASTGAQSCATLGGAKTIYLYTDVEMVFTDVVDTNNVLGGIQSGTMVGSGTTPVIQTAAVLTNQPAFTDTNITGAGVGEGYDESQYFKIAITLAETDSTFVFTPLEFSTEIL